MPYCTQQDVEDAVGGLDNLIQIADVNSEYPADGGAAYSARVSGAVQSADGIINSYLRQRFEVPLSVVPPEIVDCSANWAARILRRRSFKGQPLQSDLDDEKTAREWLSLIAKGLIQLGINPTPAKSGIVVDKVGQRDSSLSVSREKMKGFI